MKKLSKIQGSTQHIQNITLHFAQKSAWYEIIKKQVWPRQKVMVAISGGADSVVTACLMYNFFVDKKYNLQNLYFIHCNHWTRAGNSKDEKFVQKFLEGTQLIVVKRKKWNKTTEADLRKRRYEQFKQQAQTYNIKKIIFWHNLTDRIESTFLNLLRGANINGFLSMNTYESHHLLPNMHVLRPILWLTKNEIFDICKTNNIPFITDPTNNDSTTSLRNKLRNKVLPELYKLANKQTLITNTFIESMKNIYTSLEESNKKILNSKFWILNSIECSPHRNATFAYQRIIDPNDINNESIIHIMKKLHSSNNITAPLLRERTKFLQDKESGYKYFNKIYLFKSHGNIYFISASKEFWKKTIDSQKKIDTTTVKRFPRKEDRYKGKTRNEWCINQKIPIFRRNFIAIIAKGNQIIKVLR